MNSPVIIDHASVADVSRLDWFARSKVFQTLEQFDNAHLVVEDPLGITEFGCEASSRDSFHLDVRDCALYRRMLFGGVVGAAESYMDGQWTVEDLTGLIRAMVRNIESFQKFDYGWAGISRRLGRVAFRLRRNSRSGSRKNISEHYDLGNDFYQLFLDETMNYSSGIFPSDDATMYEASITKMDRVCQKLMLKPTDHLLEIGTGWGGLAIHAATHFGCRVTTTTISAEQYRMAVQRVEAAGLTDRVTVLNKDYRDLEGRFDKIVSIEMIEAVGAEYYDQFFGCCDKLLVDDGAMLLQAIIMNEQDYAGHLKSIDFIRKYIFPGGCLPSVSALSDSMRRKTRMRLTHLEEMTSHYVRTLQCWRERFMDNIEQVRELDFSETFIRKWMFYFCYCEAAFAERRTGSVQLMYAKPDFRTELIDADLFSSERQEGFKSRENVMID